MNLFLIRHCEGVANAMDLVSGDSNDQLSVRGQVQAKSLYKLVSSVGLNPKKIIVSHWRRAIQTAEIIFPGFDFLVANELGETDSGVASVLKNQIFKREYPQFFNSRKNRFPGGESHEDMFNRVIKFTLNELSEEGDMVFVTHAGPITSIIQYLLDISIDSKFPVFVPMHGSITQIQLENSALQHMVCFSVVPSAEQFRESVEKRLIWP